MPQRSAAKDPSRGNLLSIADADRPDDEVGMSPADWLADAEVADRQPPPPASWGAKWEYLIVALAEFEGAKAEKGESEAVSRLNREGANGWEAVGMTSLDKGGFAVLLKRRK